MAIKEGKLFGKTCLVGDADEMAGVLKEGEVYAFLAVDKNNVPVIVRRAVTNEDKIQKGLSDDWEVGVGVAVVAGGYLRVQNGTFEMAVDKYTPEVALPPLEVEFRDLLRRGIALDAGDKRKGDRRKS